MIRQIDVIDKNIDMIFDRVENALQKTNRSINDVNIMAVTKTVSPEHINFAFKKGIKLIGENKVQEFLSKNEEYNCEKNNIHFIGHLQSNKVKYIIDKISMIESVDSFELASRIDALSKKSGIVMPILLQINISNEETKSGFLKENLFEEIKRLKAFENINVKGFMCIPAKEKSEYYFELMQEIYEKARSTVSSSYDTLSMGMSDDFEKAIEYGSTIVRLGKLIFGERKTEVTGYESSR